MAIVTALTFFVVVTLTVKPLGSYLDAVFAGRTNVATALVRPLERLVYRICRIDRSEQMTWQSYAFALLAISVTGVACVYVAIRLQAALPLNPQRFGNLAPYLARNMAVNFATTIDWQFYSGKNTMSHLSQMSFLT